MSADVAAQDRTDQLVDFSYILDRVRAADFATVPFRHIEIHNLFTPEHFAAITGAPEILLAPQSSDEGLFDAMFAAGYKIIDFPGCITDRQAYLQWHANKDAGHEEIYSTCEGFGMTLRLFDSQSAIVEQLMAFLNSDAFQSCLSEKFGVDGGDTVYDAGIQKYMDGYEISPHPDIRKKALTYMVNINPAPDSEDHDHHTHYLTFRPEYAYVGSFWSGNEAADRTWVPWDWCETVKMQPANNSMVIFSPANDTLHAVRADYDHLVHQRTQLYGNFWYRDSQVTSKPEWQDLIIRAPEKKVEKTQGQVMAARARHIMRKITGTNGKTVVDNDGVEKRFYEK